MAKKDWDLEINKKRLIQYENNKKQAQIRIIRGQYPNEEIKESRMFWKVFDFWSNSIKTKRFKTKPEAMKYAKIYMMKH